MGLHTIAIDNSKSNGVPVLFLHGFGGLGKQWWGMQTSISFYAPTFAFDLPGHGKSLNYPNAGPPKIAAKAVLAEMAERDIEKAHLVGHSMGGAISSIIALMAPEKVASLTLLAPGGYGTQFNHPLLLEWAAARKREELDLILPQFFGGSFEMNPKIIEFNLQARAAEGAVESLTAIAKSMSSDGKQGMLDVDAVLSGDYPVTMVWGNEDKVLPVTQGEAIRDKVDLHIIEGAGHSPAEEAPEQVRALIRAQIDRGSR